MDRICVMDRVYLRGLLHPDPGIGTENHQFQHRALGNFLGSVLRLCDLRQRGVDVRAGVYLYVPLCEFPECNVF